MSANLENHLQNSPQPIGIPTLKVGEIDIALKEIKDCQTQNQTTSCMFCKNVLGCAKKERFEQTTQENLKQRQNELQACQNKKGILSCLKCAEILECEERNAYVKAVYLSMNKGNGGSFEF